ncbi:MAG: hypothetical protein JO207_02085 [Verrucomicrobia bacterium]|jgi:hypothetical protein|nr:hypothetical protein [Verrucomicrobiota bacterium]
MRYLREAFWAKMEVPYLGAIPFEWIFLKLLVAQHYLNDGGTDTNPETSGHHPSAPEKLSL